MPIYRYQCSVCGHGREVWKSLAELDRIEACLNCNFAMNRQVSAPAVASDYAPYNCPITGKRIEGREAHRANLKQHGCRVLEPGETREAMARRAAEDAKLDRSIDDSVAGFVERLSGDERHALAEGLARNDVAVQRR